MCDCLCQQGIVCYPINPSCGEGIFCTDLRGYAFLPISTSKSLYVEDEP